MEKIRIRSDYFRELGKNFGVEILKFFAADPDPGSGAVLIWDPGSRINIAGP
jgi:hypothetical protein